MTEPAESIASELVSHLLLREQYHRFSNSFQIVAALAAQGRRDPSAPDMASTLKAIQERLDALAALHRLLATGCEMQDFSNRVRDVARELVRSFGRSDTVILRSGRFWLPERHRFCLLLIVNELVTNALKHSLRNCTQGELEISARPIAEALVLTIADSSRQPLHGQLLPPSPIVAALARSIGGHAEVIDQNGYAVRVTLGLGDPPGQAVTGKWAQRGRPDASVGASW